MGLATAAAPEVEDDAVPEGAAGEAVLSPKRSRDEGVVDGGEEDAEGASKRAKVEDETELVG